MKFTVATLGCKVNQHESDMLAAGLVALGWEAAEDGEGADVCVVNTCTVTQRASMQSRQLIRQFKRAHPAARIYVTGCYAQVAPGDIEAMGGVYAIVAQGGKMALPESIVAAATKADAPAPPSGFGSPPGVSFAALPATAPGKRTRPFLKIQDGCNSFCTYCIVPYARGRSRSMPPEQVLQHLRRLDALGYREVVLTGIHLGAYGLDLAPATHLLALLDRIARQRPVARVRLSSIEPNEVTEAIIDRVASSDLFCAHFHLPLQSGDDAVLKRMHRPYDRDLFSRKVETIRDRMPSAAIGADVLIGFPGEDHAAFSSTVRLLENLPLSYLHVFPFSPRPGTPASGFSGQVPPAVIKERTAQIRSLGAAKKAAFLRSAVGHRQMTLVETGRDASTGLLKGLTSNYLPVRFEGEDGLKNTILPVTMVDVKKQGWLQGKIL